jgi:hypothetical protein
VDTLLLVVTVLSLAAAFASIMAVWKLKRTEQVRSDARVEALMAAAGSPDNGVAPLVSSATPSARPERAKRPQGRAATSDGTWNSVAGEWQWNPQPESARVTDPVPSPQPSIPSGDLFGTVRREQPASGWFAFAAALALIVALGGAVVVLTSANHDKAAAPAPRAAHATPLELMSLGHSRDARMLTINGVVRNPANGQKVEGLTAVVSLIDGNGGLISTKDVPLDYRALGPGEEAPFKVTVPDPGSIARYRVSFRAGSDVVPHVDRRTDAKLASAL